MVVFAPGDMWQCLETPLSQPGRRVLWASSPESSGVLLDIPQCPGKTPTGKGHPALKVRVLRSRSPALDVE